MTRDEELQAIARDLARCDLGIAVTQGRLLAKYRRHKAACWRRLAEIDPVAESDMTDDELLAALGL